MSGNVAYPLYGLVLASAVLGWKHGRWHWYYLAVVFASLFKIPFLTLLAFPVIVGRRQWLPAGGAAAAAGVIYTIQFRLWPGLFREYLLTIRLVFEYEHDFGLSPSGILGMKMWRMGRSHSPAITIVYLAFAVVIGIGLLALAYRVKKSDLPKEAFIPLAMVGTVLLSPRIEEYDVAAMTVPILLLAWRALRFAHDRNSQSQGNAFARGSIVVVCSVFLILNLIAGETDAGWNPTELFVLLGLFILGSWTLLRELQIAADPMV